MLHIFFLCRRNNPQYEIQEISEQRPSVWQILSIRLVRLRCMTQNWVNTRIYMLEQLKLGVHIWNITGLLKVKKYDQLFVSMSLLTMFNYLRRKSCWLLHLQVLPQLNFLADIKLPSLTSKIYQARYPRSLKNNPSPDSKVISLELREANSLENSKVHKHQN